MNKFEQMREEARKRFEREMADLERKETEAREKRITPTVAKLVAAMERAGRKFLEENVELIDGFSFRKGRIEERIAAMLAEAFAASDKDKSSDEAGRDDDGETVPAEEVKTPGEATVETSESATNSPAE